MERLETSKFRLELIQESHLQELKKYALEKPLWKFSTVEIHTEKDFEEYFNQALNLTQNTSQRAFVVYDIVNEKYIGMTRLYGFDKKNKSTKLGFTWYATEAQGKGVNPHSKYLILKYAFENLNIERIELNADLRNERSIAAMKKLGATQEGILRKSLYLPDGHKRDTIIFSILNEDWENNIKSLLLNKISEN